MAGEPLAQKCAAPNRPPAPYRTQPHPLLGLAVCAPCNALLGAAGINDGRICYRCRNRKYGCPTDTLITERVMLREMARQLPRILVRTTEVTSTMWAKPGIGGDVKARLAAIR